MGLRQRINEAASASIRWNEDTLPVLGERVLMKGLMGGEQMVCLRMAVLQGSNDIAVDIYSIVSIAYGAYDPDTKERMWNPDLLSDRAEIAALHIDDLTFLANGIKELSDREGGDAGKAGGNSPEISILRTA